MISLAKADGGIICFTLVVPEIREYLIAEAEKANVLYYDIIGPLIDKMETAYGLTAKYEPGRVRQLDEDYFKKVEAIEFAVKYDDGRDPRGILKADIVLIGVSRTSKTPLSQYLAHKRLKVANVPIVPEVDPPEELFNVDPKKCIGLKISPDKLNHIRKERLKSLGLNDKAIYANINRIKEELEYFEKIVDRIEYAKLLMFQIKRLRKQQILSIISKQKTYNSGRSILGFWLCEKGIMKNNSIFVKFVL